MERTELIDQLTQIFRKVFNSTILNLTNELTPNDVAQWDSLSHMILINEVENSFSIKFKLKELNRMKNVGDMIEMIISKL